MDRRSALRSFVIISAGIAIMPSCREEKVKGTVSLKNIQLSGEQENLLADLSQTILPVKQVAPSEATHYFVLMMVDDCYSKENQQQFMQGLEQLDKLAGKKFDRSFAKCSVEQKHALLNGLESKKNGEEAVNYFYNTVRSLTVQHYTTSKYYMVSVHKYEMAPGRFHGCFPVNKSA